MNQLLINTDGGSRGNPGPAAIGVVFMNNEGGVIYTHKEYIGLKTNNEAEYEALIKACDILSKSKWLRENNTDGEVICRLDSKLVVEQITGNYKVKQDHLKGLIAKIKDFSDKYKVKILFRHIPREQNKLADKLVNEALDEYLANVKR